jgi:hypothetical protein
MFIATLSVGATMQMEFARPASDLMAGMMA